MYLIDNALVESFFMVERRMPVAKLKTSKVKMGIRFKLMSMFILLIALPLTIVGVMIYLRSYENIVTDLEKNSKASLDIMEESVGNYLREFKFMAELSANDPSSQSLLTDPKSEEQLLTRFDQVVKADKDVMAIYLGDLNGKMYIKPDQQLPEGYDPRVRGWFKAAQEKGELIFTAPYVDAFTGKLVISPAIPIYDKSAGNAFVGVIGADVLLDTVVEAVSSAKIGKTGFISIIGPDLVITSHPNKDLIGKNIETDLNIVSLTEGIKKLAGSADNEVFLKYEYAGAQKYATVKKSNLGYLVAFFERSEVTEGASANLIFIVTLGIGALVLAVIISWLFSKSLTARIQHMMQLLQRVRDGDLTVAFKHDNSDEIGLIGHHLSDTISELSLLISDVKQIAGEVTISAQNLAATSEETSASAEEVARTANEIAKGATEQASEAEKGVAIAKNLTNKFDELNNRTATMIESAKSVMEANETGIKSLDALKSKSRLSDEANDRIESVISELDKKTQSIEAILDSISAIAVQTNLLALNASIEAARAGEHGRGFAVVAEEIRKLAEESSQAADEVRVIVTNIQADSTKTVSSMKDVREISNEQSHAVHEVSGSFQTIFNSIENISDMIKSISSFIMDLGKDESNIMQAIENISAVSEETAAASEEVSSSMDQQSLAVDEVAKSAERLNEISAELNERIAKFKV